MALTSREMPLLHAAAVSPASSFHMRQMLFLLGTCFIEALRNYQM
jgi:hypothetical protein